MAAGDARRRDALILTRIHRIRRRLNGQAWLELAVVPLWCAATFVALYRLLLGSHTAIAVGVALAAAGAWWWSRSRRRAVGVDEAAAILDRSADAGGLLLTRLEVPVGAWELALNDRVLRARLPQVKRGRPAALAGMAALFLLVTLAIPAPKALARTVNAAAATRVAQVEAFAEALAQVTPLEESVADELARLREELAEGRFDAADWEAADHLESELASMAAAAAQELSKAQDAARALEQALANAGDAEAGAREREALEDALASLDGQGPGALERALSGAEAEQGQQGQGEGEQSKTGQQGQGEPKEGADGEGPQGQGKQGAAGQKPGQEGKPGTGKPGAGKPSRSQVSELRRALAQRQEQLEKAYGQQGPRRPQHAQGPKKGGQCPNAGKPGHSHAGGQCEGNGDGTGDGQRGKAGIGRGGGPGELTFDESVEVNPERLAFAPLPEGQGGDEPGELWGLRAVDPRVATEQGAPRAGGALAEGRQAPGHDQGAALPRNRALVRRYFDTK